MGDGVIEGRAVGGGGGGTEGARVAVSVGTAVGAGVVVGGGVVGGTAVRVTVWVGSVGTAVGEVGWQPMHSSHNHKSQRCLARRVI